MKKVIAIAMAATMLLTACGDKVSDLSLERQSAAQGYQAAIDALQAR